MPSALNSPTPTRPTPRAQRRRLPAAPFLIGALIAASLLAAGSRIDWSSLGDSLSPFQDDSPETLALPGCATGRPEVTIAVLDVSSSVIDSGGADPHGRSFDETRLLAKALNQAPCSRDDRFGAVIFANQAVEMPPTLVSSQSIIGRNLVRPPKSEIGSGTELVRAFDLAHQVAGRHAEADVTVLVLSDMQGDDPHEVDRQLSAMTASHMHLIALGHHDDRYDRLFDTVTELDQADEGAVAAALAEAVASSRRNPPSSASAGNTPAGA